MRLIVLLLAILPAAGAQCLIVDGEWVTARDVGERVPRLATADPDLRLVRAPFPGARRVITAASLAAFEGVPAGPDAMTPFCVERRMQPLSREVFMEAVSRSLTGKGEAEIKVDLVDYDRSALPSGRLEFLTQSLPPPVLGRLNEPVMWRGKLFYSEAHSVPVWVRVRLWREEQVCLLNRDVARGEDLTPADCKLGKATIAPFGPALLLDSAGLERMVAARHMKAEEPIYQALVVPKPDVEAGKTVEMKVVNGGAQVRFQAKAVSSGRRGDSVSVTNPVNGKRLEGQVTGQGSVEVHLK